MRTSAPGPCKGRFPHGFTLIEILVVLVILGVVAAMIGVNFAPDRHQVLETEARRLALLLEQARDEAMSGGASIAFNAGADGYRFQRRQAGEGGAKQWQDYGPGDVFRPRRLPEEVGVVEFTVNGQPLAKDQALVFSPSGVGLPFALVLAIGNDRVAIAGDGLGRIAQGPPGSRDESRS